MALAEAMGLDLSRMQVVKGARPGEGALTADERATLRAFLGSPDGIEGTAGSPQKLYNIVASDNYPTLGDSLLQHGRLTPAPVAGR